MSCVACGSKPVMSMGKATRSVFDVSAAAFAAAACAPVLTATMATVATVAASRAMRMNTVAFIHGILCLLTAMHANLDGGGTTMMSAERPSATDDPSGATRGFTPPLVERAALNVVTVVGAALCAFGILLWIAANWDTIG